MSARLRHLLALVLAGGLLSVAAASLGAQAEGQLPDLEELEARFEEVFAAALAQPEDTEPMRWLMSWGVVLQSKTMLEHVRALSLGAERPAGTAAVEEVLSRWRETQPDAAGPDLLRAVQIQDQEQKRAAVEALLDRYPDGLQVVNQAAWLARGSGQPQRAEEVLQGYLARHPERPIAHQMLFGHYSNVQNETKRDAALLGWARVAPKDPQLVDAWLRSNLSRQDPEGTERLLAQFLAGAPVDEASLNVCLTLAHSGEERRRQQGRACVARLAASAAAAPSVVERATGSLVELAAEEGDWRGLLASLELLPPEASLQATIAAARRLETPGRCHEVIELLSAAAEALSEDANQYSSIGSALRGCQSVAAAQALFLELLERAPASSARSLLWSWVSRVNDRLRGELPAAAASVLERRIEREPEAEDLYEALDATYELLGPEERRFALLKRRLERFPRSLRGAQAIALATGLAFRDDLPGAIRVLEAQLDVRSEAEVADLLFSLVLGSEGPPAAERLAARLVASSRQSQIATGHLMGGRLALMAEDGARAEAEYWQALQGEFPRRDAAVEWLQATAYLGEEERVGPLALRICEQTSLGKAPNNPEKCAAELLAKAGSGEQALPFLAAQSADLPGDPRSLEELAETAETAGQLEVAEQALRGIVEVDPEDESGWQRLAAFLLRAERPQEVEAVVASARQRFEPPPSELLRTLGSARIATGEAEGAIEALQEARRLLPPGAATGWIDADLQKAYRLLGEQLPPPEPRIASPPRQPPPELVQIEGTPGELRVAAEALLTGSGGRYDPLAGQLLAERAAASGEPLAAFRWALLLTPGMGRVSDPERAAALYRSARTAVEEGANGGDAYAQYLLGTAALIGLGQPADAVLARRWLERAAAAGDSWALHNLAWMAEVGRGLAEPDRDAALGLYRRACERGNVASMHSFARLTLTLDGSGPLCEEGLSWLRRAAAAGPTMATFLGKVLSHGRGKCVERQPKAALPWLRTAMETGDLGAAYDLALLLAVGDAGESDPAQIEELFGRTAEAGWAIAAEVLSFLRATGVGLPRDLVEAERWSAESARRGSDGFPRLKSEAASFESSRKLLALGIERLEALVAKRDPAAQALLGQLLLRGGIAGLEGHERAIPLAQQAAARGQGRAMRLLGNAYQYGRGVDVDSEQAVRWYRKGAELGESFCMMFYGDALLRGEMTQRDQARGVEWLTRAAETGNWWAVGEIANLWDEGRFGVKRDEEKAVEWKRLRAALGDAEARGWLAWFGYGG